MQRLKIDFTCEIIAVRRYSVQLAYVACTSVSVQWNVFCGINYSPSLQWATLLFTHLRAKILWSKCAWRTDKAEHGSLMILKGTVTRTKSNCAGLKCKQRRKNKREKQRDDNKRAVTRVFRRCTDKNRQQARAGVRGFPTSAIIFYGRSVNDGSD